MTKGTPTSSQIIWLEQEIERLRGEVERLTWRWTEKDAAWREQAYEDAQKLDAALARAETAERERDERNARMWETAEELGRTEARANAAEAKVAKLRGALAPFGAWCSEMEDYNPNIKDDVRVASSITMEDTRRARTALQETE